MKFRTNSFKYARKLFLLMGLSVFVCSFSACPGKGGSSQSDGTSLLSSDETSEAVELIQAANGDLKKVKDIYRKNQARVEELQTAMKDKDNDKVREIANELVFQVNDGMELGKSAVEKVKQAEELSINDTFKEYLEMKSEALEKQLEAFEFRRQAAQLLRDAYTGKDVKENEKVITVFKEKEGNFQKLWDEGREKSQEAIVFAKENAREAR